MSPRPILYGRETETASGVSWWARSEVQTNRDAFDAAQAREQARLSGLTYAAGAQAHPAHPPNATGRPSSTRVKVGA